MKCMNRNKVSFFYALYKSREPILNTQGRATGQYKLIYGKPIEERANVSAAKGEMQTEQFGESETYDKVIVMELGTPINEYSRLWVDTMPQLDEDGSLALDEKGEIITPHDYVVKKVAKSLNSVSFAISKVTVS